MWSKGIRMFLVASAGIAGCASPDEGFTLPQGDADRGKANFVSFGCVECHSIHHAELPKPDAPGGRILKLGGDVEYAKSYEDLVTGIINPSHRLAKGYKPSAAAVEGQSPMKVYNDIMTVAQLIDVVTFLQEHYVPIPRDQTPYPEYIYVP